MIERLRAALEGRYRIEHELGEGGSATVFLAEDLRHERQVALKVFKPDVAAVLGVDRFLAEIKTTANLQHPHILPLYDSGEAGGFLFYAMPYVEGETLRERLDRETQLGVEEAVRLTVEVADALDYAHRSGIVHRDVKPENVLLHDGRAIVADFGIAIALSAAGGGRMTETGLSLGTPFYMSPEQATAEKELTPRADVYALGSVLYEMLAGDPPHTGSSAQQVIVKIISEEARPVHELRRSVPPHVSDAIRKAIERLPADRFSSAREFAEALKNPSFSYGESTDAAAASTAGPFRSARAPSHGALALAVVPLVVIAAWGWLRTPGATTTPPATESRLYLGESVVESPWSQFAISPDGRRLAVSAPDSSGVRFIWVRDLASERVEQVPSSRNAWFPFWAPDGDRVGFTAEGEIRAVELASERSRVLCPTDARLPATWSRDGEILFTHQRRIHRVRADGQGSACEPVTPPDSAGERPLERWPRALPGGRVLFWAGSPGGTFVAEPDGTVRSLLPAAWNATFVEPDLLVYHDSPLGGGSRVGALPLLARRFDPERLEFLSEPVTIYPSTWTPGGIARYSIAPSGPLVIVHAPTQKSTLAWVERDGVVSDRWPEESAWMKQPSRDGTRVAMGGFGLWIYDVERGLAERLLPSFDETRIFSFPSWSPADSLLAFDGSVSGPNQLYVYDLRAGRLDTLRTEPGRFRTATWSPAGDAILYRLRNRELSRESDIWVHHLATEEARRLFSAPHAEDVRLTLSFSPDGGWLLYSSDETGLDDIYVRSWPDLDAPRPITASGGILGQWSANGDTIFYATEAGSVMGVPFASGRLGTPVRVQSGDDFHELWGVHPATGAFLRVERGAESRAPSIRLVTGWRARLEGSGGR